MRSLLFLLCMNAISAISPLYESLLYESLRIAISIQSLLSRIGMHCIIQTGIICFARYFYISKMVFQLQHPVSIFCNAIRSTMARVSALRVLLTTLLICLDCQAMGMYWLLLPTKKLCSLPETHHQSGKQRMHHCML